MSNTHSSEVDKIVDGLILSYGEHIEADDDLSDWHIEKPIIFKRRLVEAKQSILALIDKAVQEARVEGMLEGVELGANQVGQLVKEVVKDYDQIGSLIKDNTLKKLQSKQGKEG